MRGSDRLRLRVIGGISAAGGLVLLVWALRLVGIYAVADGFRRLGAGVVLVVLLGGVRHLVRCLAWRLCFAENEAPSIARAFGVYVAGDAIGNVTPLGTLASEPSKVVLLRAHTGTASAIAALTLENLFYGGSVLLVLLAGTAALLATFAVAPAVRAASAAVVAGAVACAAVALLVIIARRPVLSRAVIRIGRDPSRARDIEERVFGFAATHRARLLPIAALELSFHITAVIEVWFVLRSIGVAAGPITAFVLEYVNRTITIVFQFVPMWVGVDEAGSGLIAAVIGVGPAAGVTLALVRKARVAAWTAVGLIIAAVMRFASTNVQLRAPGWRGPAPSAPPPPATASRAPHL